MPQNHQGSCHCGRVTFEVRADLDYVIDCNCSLCRRRGALWHGVPGSSLRILTGEADLALYEFNTKTAKHYFCRHCGIHPFIHPRLDPSAWAVNVRCIDGVDLSTIPVRPFDGANWEVAAKAFYQSRK
ncbi:MAG TPA: GFA family protein [Candidatus Dormibacteraeota bacterium]|nr:GFA family protein [Candidatus Dormibacteraeota bacterium]